MLCQVICISLATHCGSTLGPGLHLGPLSRSGDLGLETTSLESNLHINFSVA